MRDDEALTKLCAATFVAELFDQAEKRAALRGTTITRAPVLEFMFDSWDDRRSDRVRRLACNALAACERKDRPSWAPDLPVSCDELDSLPDDLTLRTLLVHEFALSQRHHNWDPQHPCFRDYARSAMAHTYAPDKILRPDPELRREFPPEPLIELFTQLAPRGVTLLLWRSPQMIARDKAAAQRWIDRGVPEEEARRAFGC
jgi:hypothetical protein